MTGSEHSAALVGCSWYAVVNYQKWCKEGQRSHRRASIAETAEKLNAGHEHTMMAPVYHDHDHGAVEQGRVTIHLLAGFKGSANARHYKTPSEVLWILCLGTSELFLQHNLHDVRQVVLMMWLISVNCSEMLFEDRNILHFTFQSPRSTEQVTFLSTHYCSLHRDDNNIIFKNLPFETLFQKFVFSTPQNTVVV